MPQRAGRRGGIVVVAVLTLLVGGCSTSPGDADSNASAPPGGATTVGSTGAPSPAIQWRTCGRGAQCGTLRVPLDHAQPNGSTLDLAVARRPALQPARRIGSLIVNPGGPGASGVDMVKDFGLPFDSISDRFDLVSWDPRGVGASAPVACDGATPDYRELDWAPDDDGEQTDLDDGARRIAQDCAKAAGERLRHLSTADAAADLDLLRAAVGDERLTFAGFSYATAIGLAYAERFPDKVRAIVLDGVVDPHHDLEASLAGQAEALEDAVDEVFRRCDDRPDCPVDDPGRVYDELARSVETNPLPAGTKTLGPTALTFAVVGSSYDPSSADDMLRSLAAARNGDGAPLRRMAEGYWSSASYSSYVAVNCVDLPHPTDARGFGQMADRVARRAPRFGAMLVNDLRPCAFWDAPTTGVPGRVRAAGAPPILVVGATGDVATPYASAVRVAEELDRGHLLTRVGDGHGSYGRSDCIAEHVDRYLVSLTLPAEDARCR